ncbi:CaiB/BaiF CoA transferase family protein [Thermodesulfobacteriota bacterium]
MEMMLSSYRVLDLTSGGYLMAGRVLADLGADVVKIEKPGGDDSRNRGPFYHQTPDPEKSLFWFAYNLGKRGITLDISKPDGKELFKKLVKNTQVVLESYPPGYMEELGLGYAALSQINPGVILTSITPYGQSGPYAAYEASDIVMMGMGGLAYITGYPDGPPMRPSCPQSAVVAGCQAAAATTIALFHKSMTGEGQHVDTSTQASVAWTMTNAVSMWELSQFNIRRLGSVLRGREGGPRQHLLWQCKDGYVVFPIMGGVFFSGDNNALTKWMDEEGMADDFLREFDWENYDMAEATQEIHSRLENPIGLFFLTHTREELYDGGFKRGIKIYPSHSPKGVLNDPQLKARDYWVKVNHPELDQDLTYPGSFYQTTGSAFRAARRPPLVGEHNPDLYSEIGLSAAEMQILKQSSII